MELSLGFSPCPNDTFIFYALVTGKIDTHGLKFIPHIMDVEALNNLAFDQTLMITKISINAYLNLIDDYVILNSGAALGKNCGPLIIANESILPSDLPDKKIGVPGELTTAHFLLDYFKPGLKHKEFFLFSEIEDAVLTRRVDAGVIIHENRFTYEQKGLKLVKDLGSYWEQQTNSPIPLGGIIARRDLPRNVAAKINKCIADSLKYAWEHEGEVLDYCRSYAQEMDEQVMKNHISLYVNEYSMNLGLEGKAAIRNFFDVAYNLGKIARVYQPVFLS
jgi:1,4-dihydroxy-6-naphthoate synthase